MVALQSTHEYVAVVPKKQIKKVLSIASGRTANRKWSFELVMIPLWMDMTPKVQKRSETGDLDSGSDLS